MLALFFGCLGFFCYFLYDVNSVRKLSGWMGTLFVDRKRFCGCRNRNFILVKQGGFFVRAF